MIVGTGKPTEEEKKMLSRRITLPADKKPKNNYKVGLTNEVVAVALFEYLTGLVYDDGARFYLADYCKLIKRNPSSCIKEGDNFEQIFLRNCLDNPDFAFTTNQKDLLIKVLRAEVRMNSLLASAYSMQSAFNTTVVETTRKTKQFTEAKDFIDLNKPFIGMPEKVMKIVDVVRQNVVLSNGHEFYDEKDIGRESQNPALYQGRDGIYAIYSDRVDVLKHQYFKGTIYRHNDETMKSVDFVRRCIESVATGNKYAKKQYETPTV